jgi:transmembrane sensor
VFELAGLHKMVTSAGRFIGCTAIAAVALLYVERQDWRADTCPQGAVHSTAVGEVRHLLLEDGSRVDLNTNSEIVTRVEANRRVTLLIRGEARFRVDHNDRTAFLVVAGQAGVKSTDADFSVRLVNSSRVDVLVKAGRADISVAPPEVPRPGLQLSPPLVLTMSSGESISLRSNSVYAREQLSAVVLERRTAWTDGWLWFAAEPLPQALAEFNRYHEQQLVLVDPRLASLRIGGRFRSSDLDSFIATLEHSFDVRTASTTLPGARAATIYLSERCSRALQQCN